MTVEDLHGNVLEVGTVGRVWDEVSDKTWTAKLTSVDVAEGASPRAGAHFEGVLGWLEFDYVGEWPDAPANLTGGACFSDCFVRSDEEVAA